MRKSILILLAAVALMACNRTKSDSTLTWGNDTLTRFGERDVVGLIYPKAQGSAAADSMNQVLTASLRDFFADEEGASSLSDAVDSLLARKNRDSMTAHLNYMLQAEGDVFTRGALTSVELIALSYTGGAHGITSGRYFNFDNRTGELLERDQLFKDTIRLAELNRAAFKRYFESERQENDLSYLFVNLDSLALPENIGFDTAGVRMLYNPYEIAAYVFGSSEYSIPYKEVESILERIAKDK